jgi:hypothetical protein
MRPVSQPLIVLAWLQLLLLVAHSFTCRCPFASISHVESARPLKLNILSLSSSSSSPSLSSSDTTEKQRGGISLSMEELADILGGTGRAKLCWDLYAIGVDPADYFGTHALYANEDRDSISRLLPSSRRNLSLGKHALERLASLYPQQGGQVEGGVASLSDISTSRDLTTKLLLRLHDGLEVETVIIPLEGVRSTLCISSQVGCSQGCKFCATGKPPKSNPCIDWIKRLSLTCMDKYLGIADLCLYTSCALDHTQHATQHATY